MYSTHDIANVLFYTSDILRLKCQAAKYVQLYHYHHHLSVFLREKNICTYIQVRQEKTVIFAFVRSNLYYTKNERYFEY